MQAELQKQQVKLQEGLRKALSDSLEELALYDNHPADIGSETFEREKDLALADNLEIQLTKVAEALARIASGEYGLCRTCGREIPEERLWAAPETTLCLLCRRREEEADTNRKRPVEEEVISSLLRTGGVDRKGRGYDAEDAWQEVAQPNKLPYVFEGDIDVGRDEQEGIALENLPYTRDEKGTIWRTYPRKTPPVP